MNEFKARLQSNAPGDNQSGTLLENDEDRWRLTGGGPEESEHEYFNRQCTITNRSGLDEEKSSDERLSEDCPTSSSSFSKPASPGSSSSATSASSNDANECLAAYVNFNDFYESFDKYQDKALLADLYI